jgi:hypothetical protein
VSSEDHPKEPDETREDGKNARSKMFPPKSAFFSHRTCALTRLRTRCRPAAVNHALGIPFPSLRPPPRLPFPSPRLSPFLPPPSFSAIAPLPTFLFLPFCSRICSPRPAATPHHLPFSSPREAPPAAPPLLSCRPGSWCRAPESRPAFPRSLHQGHTTARCCQRSRGIMWRCPLLLLTPLTPRSRADGQGTM